MATVRTLNLFPLNSIGVAFSDRSMPPCPQPAEDFSFRATDTSVLRFAPATLPQSGYVPMSLKRALLWYWRIKEWEVTVDAEWLGDAQKGTFVLASNSTSERHKICNRTRFDGGSSSSEADNAEGSWEIDIDIGRVDTAWANYPETPRIFRSASQPIRFSKDRSVFYYNAYINFQTDEGGGGGLGENYISGTLGVSDSVISQTQLTYTFEDSEGTTTRPFMINTDPQSTTPITGDILFKPKSYWPYDPEDGDGPIYDSDTGRQLRAFPD